VTPSIRKLPGRVGLATVTTLACAVALFPLYWMLRTAFAPEDAVFFRGISPWPDEVTLANFSRAWSEATRRVGPS
jgi:ABC-type glycerol-3-phosphate transport system permease component